MTTTGEERERGFDHTEIEPRWQRTWEDADVFRIADDETDPEYVLAMFPYTSGSLHMGHVRNYTITDAFARFERMRGESVLHPMGWDSFGLPAENAAEERDTNPRDWTMQCIESMRDQLKEMGFGYDWERELATCEPEYYRWNQWLFKQFREAGLVERQAAELNWCPSCETVLADEQVEGEAELCWRCDTPIEHREMDQWFFTITDYAEELLTALDDLDGWPNNVREMQRNWIGKQEGASVAFEVGDYGAVDIFTTRLDTIHGATYFSLAPGHPVAQAIAEENEDVAEYVEMAEAADEDDLDVTSGVFTGEYATNPATGEEIPVYVADYVLTDVGTGALYAVPAHDERDHEFAEAHDIDIVQVVEPTEDADVAPEDVDVQEAAYTEDGRLVNSGEFDGLTSEAARDRFVDEFDGEHRTEYNLRDWGISRQRYWGTPIPMIRCDDCGYVEVPDEDLPVELPEFVHTTGNPLDAAEEWKHVDCPDCGADAVRETDTMDTFVDSSWYFLRFLSPQFEDAPFDQTTADEWLPVDVYVGGEEHAVLHLLYIRFFARALSDIGLLDRDEPVERLINQGTVLHGGEKMSKSKGNDIAPHEYGAETTRLFVLSAAHPSQDFEWTVKDVSTAYDFQQTLYRLVAEYADGMDARTESADHDAYLEREIDRTIAAVTEEYERFRFHRVVGELQRFARLLGRYASHDRPYKFAYGRGLRVLTALVAPIAPFLAEEMWHLLDEDGLVAERHWPESLRDVDDYRLEREVVRRTLDDVRDITEVVDIEEPDEIELVVAADWKYRAYEIAREADPDAAIVGEIMADEGIKAHGDAAADYAGDLADRGAGLEPIVDGERELDVLRQAAWLFEDEFGSEVTVRRATDGDDLAAKARPNKPAIHIS